MAKNWALTIGINQYEFLQPLKYAKRDAELVQQFFLAEAGFERVFFFSDDSPDVGGKSTRPYRTNLLRVLRQLFDKPFMGAGDNFWFFFSGHGMRHAERDYLMPSDGDPGDIENTAIAINHVTERLRSCGADNVVLILDACRSQGFKAGEGIGQQTAEKARQTGVISIFSCSPNEYSFEIEELQQGAFTHALLEGLGSQGQCATVEQLNQYLTWRVPELVAQHKNTQQTPYTIAEPVTKSHLILLPKYATQADVATLKNYAYQALFDEDLNLAEQLWIRVLGAAAGQDMEAVKALQKIERLRVGRIETKTQSSSADSVSGGKSPTSDIADYSAEIQPITLPGQDDLQSARGVEYFRLRDLLSAGKWKEADQETAAVMLKVADREKEGFLRVKDIAKFPCQDLQTINTLWRKYSKGRFGFSVQKSVWEAGLSPNADNVIECNFGESLGWRIKGKWLDYNELTFSLAAPEGYLPRLCLGNIEGLRWSVGMDAPRMSLYDFFSRIENCQL